MKLNISYLKTRYIIDVSPSDNIYKIKCKVEKAALVPSPCSAATYTKGQSTLMFNGTVLKDNVVISDIGLKSGQTLTYRLMETQQIKLRILVKFLRKDIELGKEIEDIGSITVGDVREILQNLIGIPMSIFYLVHPEKDHELFDMHGLSYYGIKEGDTLILSIWKGTRGVIMGALNSDISKTMSNLPNFFENPTLNRYLLRVVLFIAAHNDYTKLAALVLQRGIRCEEAVGEHSSRQWCSRQSHPGIFKTPVHQAAQMGSFSCLKMFVRYSPSCMICKDAYHLTPSSYASKYKNFECWKLLIASQFVHAKINGFSLASHARIMRWCTAAKERVNYFKGEGIKHSILLHSTIGKNNNTYLGNEITVAGFKSDDNKRFKRIWTRKLAPITPIISEKGTTTTRKKSGVARSKIEDSSRINYNSCKENPWRMQSATSATSTRVDNNSKALKDAPKGIQEKANTAGGDVISKKPHKTVMNKSTKFLTTPNVYSRKKKRIKTEVTKESNNESNFEVTSDFCFVKPSTSLKLETQSVDKDIAAYATNNTNILKRSSSCDSIDVSTKQNESYTSVKRSSSLLSFKNIEERAKVQILILEATGMSLKDLANDCFELGEAFNSRSWMKKFRIAINSSTNRIKRGRPRTAVPKIPDP